MFIKIFEDRADAGRFLATKLDQFANHADALVLGVPRGGVQVAFEVAQKLKLPLDVLVVRKLGVPGHEELAMGAIAAGGVRVLNQDVLSMIEIPADILELVIESEQSELERREAEYRHNRPPLKLRGRTVIVVDDGLATGSSMHAAVRAVRQQHPKKIVVAVPVGARETCESFQNEVDTMAICAVTPERFQSVGSWYADFSQTTDDQVRRCLEWSGPSRQAA